MKVDWVSRSRMYGQGVEVDVTVLLRDMAEAAEFVAYVERFRELNYG